MRKSSREAVRAATGAEVKHVAPLHGGCVAMVRRLTLTDGSRIVAKIGDETDPRSLPLEGRMLTYLQENTSFPVPDVLLARPGLLLMDYIESDGCPDESAAADCLAALHSHSAENYGFTENTLIGGLPQANPQETSWPQFFAEHRLMNMGRQAHQAGNLPGKTLARLENLAARITGFLDEPPAPALIHGDMWSGNILWSAGGPVFVDPALYFADNEMEMTFATVWSTFGRRFFDRYTEHIPLRPGFQDRREIHNLFCLLVHARLFGGSYPRQVAHVLGRYGL